MIYLDNNATTMMPEAVRAEYVRWTNHGNPSASYASAKACRAMFDQFRAYIASVCDFKLTGSGPRDNSFRIIFTSCGSESNCMIIRGAVEAYGKHAKPHVVLSAVEHKSSIECVKRLEESNAAEVTYVFPEISGHVTPSAVRAAIKPNTCLVSIMHANNETGAINDIGAIGKLCHAAGVPFHTDAVQTFGKNPVTPGRLNVDAFSVAFHKTNGPPGVGALVIRNRFLIGYKMSSLVHGTQNDGLRGGTENTPGIGASYLALRHCLTGRLEKNARVRSLRNLILDELAARAPVRTYASYLKNIPPLYEVEIILLSGDDGYTHNTILLSVLRRTGARVCNAQIKGQLDTCGIIVSIGSACNTASSSASHVLTAMGCDALVRAGTLRISLGDDTTREDAETFCKVFLSIVKNIANSSRPPSASGARGVTDNS